MYPHTDKTQRWAFKFSDVLTCQSPCPNTTQIWTNDNIFYFEFTIGLKIFSNFTGKPVESKYLFQGRKSKMFAGDLLPFQKQSRSTLVPKSFHKKTSLRPVYCQKTSRLQCTASRLSQNVSEQSYHSCSPSKATLPWHTRISLPLAEWACSCVSLENAK